VGTVDPLNVFDDGQSIGLWLGRKLGCGLVIKQFC
jgi:hypothetical protein